MIKFLGLNCVKLTSHTIINFIYQPLSIDIIDIVINLKKYYNILIYNNVKLINV